MASSVKCKVRIEGTGAQLITCSNLTQNVTEAFQWCEMFAECCLDIEKAFDVVWRLGLQNKGQKIGLHKPVIKLVNSFLSLRSIFVKINISKK